MQAAKKARTDSPSAAAPAPAAAAAPDTETMVSFTLDYKYRSPAAVSIKVLLHDTVRLPPCRLARMVEDQHAAGYPGLSTWLWWSPCTERPLVLLGFPGEADSVTLTYTTRKLESDAAAWFVQKAYALWYEVARPGSWSPSYGEEEDPNASKYPAPEITARRPARSTVWPRVMGPDMTSNSVQFKDGKTRSVHFFPNDGVYVVEVKRGHTDVPAFVTYAMVTDAQVPETRLQLATHNWTAVTGKVEAEYPTDVKKYELA